jgi:hypothetical protein
MRPRRITVADLDLEALKLRREQGRQVGWLVKLDAETTDALIAEAERLRDENERLRRLGDRLAQRVGDYIAQTYDGIATPEHRDAMDVSARCWIAGARTQEGGTDG